LLLCDLGIALAQLGAVLALRKARYQVARPNRRPFVDVDLLDDPFDSGPHVRIASA
jgi:hypothetical protein